MTWTPPQPTPYFLCAHSGVAMPLPRKVPTASTGLGAPSHAYTPAPLAFWAGGSGLPWYSVFLTQAAASPLILSMRCRGHQQLLVGRGISCGGCHSKWSPHGAAEWGTAGSDDSAAVRRLQRERHRWMDHSSRTRCLLASWQNWAVAGANRVSPHVRNPLRHHLRPCASCWWSNACMLWGQGSAVIIHLLCLEQGRSAWMCFSRGQPAQRSRWHDLRMRPSQYQTLATAAAHWQVPDPCGAEHVIKEASCNHMMAAGTWQQPSCDDCPAGDGNRGRGQP